MMMMCNVLCGKAVDVRPVVINDSNDDLTIFYTLVDVLSVDEWFVIFY